MRTKLYTLIALGLLLGLASCKEKDLSTDNPVVTENNVILAGSFIYEGQDLRSDTGVITAQGQRLFVEEIRFLISKFYFVDVNTGDTTESDEPFSISFTNTDNAFTRIPNGGYTIYTALDLGFDSLASVTAPMDYPNNEALNDDDFKRNFGQGLGYNHMIFKGRVVDPSNPDDSTGTIPVLYQIGTPELQANIRGEVLNFGLNTGRSARFVFAIDLTDAIDNTDFIARPIVTSNPTDAADFNAAFDFLNDTEFNIF